MCWEERVNSLDMAALHNIVGHLVYINGLEERGYSVENVLADTLYFTWEHIDNYNPLKSSFQTWFVWQVRSRIDLYKRRRTWSVPFAHLPEFVVRNIESAYPSPLESVIRTEEIVDTAETIKKIENAIMLSGHRSGTKDRDLVVLRTYLRLLRDSAHLSVTQQDVANALSVSQQTISNVLTRIAKVCKEAGLSV